MKTFNKFSFLIFLSLFLIQCSSDELEEETGGDGMQEVEEMIMEETVSFSKSNTADPTSEASQDRITENVWITRGNSGGEIYNAKTEDASEKGVSPAGTRWALGVASNKDNLEFNSFRATVGKPKDVVGKELVMHLVEDDMYINVKFTSWSEGGQNTDAGGFAYDRTKLE